ncbi:MAG: NADH-quinone oxidoreductase subunit C [Coriobacteriales bacterium]|nr:NADH-quinone oxidoreductase subunit C [Coriobacteriales bacterium]
MSETDTKKASAKPAAPAAEPFQHPARAQQPEHFRASAPDQLIGEAKRYQEAGWRFVNICGSTTIDGIELLYSFGRMEELENLTMIVQVGDTVPSISPVFENAFFFENETQDLYGIHFEGLILDYKQKFYGPVEAHPMAHNIQVIERKQKAAAAAAKASPEQTGSASAAGTDPSGTASQQKGGEA